MNEGRKDSKQLAINSLRRYSGESLGLPTVLLEALDGAVSLAIDIW
jgi:hypothetical protein